MKLTTGGTMRQSIQKQLGLIKEDNTIKVRTARPYNRKEKHKTDYISHI
jgi:hypothetical protein